MQKNKGLLLILLLILALVGCVLVFNLINKKDSDNDNDQSKGSNGNNKACTMEAKLCPDGSYVSRTLPNCEFASCPKK